MKWIRQAKWCYVICSILFAATGIVMMLLPTIAVKLFCIIIGVMLLLLGIVKIIGYVSHDLYNLAFQFDLALGIFAAAAGIVLITATDRILTFFPVFIGAFILIDSAFKIQTACDAKRFGLANWWLILLGAVLCSGLGITLILDPFSGGILLTRFIGLSLLCTGAENLFNALYTVKIIKRDGNTVYINESDYEVR